MFLVQKFIRSFFRPHCNNNVSVPKEAEVKNLIQEWLQLTAASIEKGLERSLELVTNLKGLYLIREEALKIGNSRFNIPKSNLTYFYVFRDSRRLGTNLLPDESAGKI